MIERPLYMEKIEPFIDAPLAKIITGIRRSGKSTILEMVEKRLQERGVPKEKIFYALNWLRRVLPQLSEGDRVKVVKGLIKVGRQGALAWGQFDNGVITLSNIAAEGTTYHEAFHAVFNLLLDQSERQALYDEARRIYGEKDNLSLEEDMAEGFREYVMTRQNRGLGQKIIDFFKELFAKVTHWNNFRPSLTSYYQRINEGKYADSNYKVPTISELRGAAPNTTTFNSLSETIRENLTKKGWTAEKFDSISQEERDHALRCIAF